MTRGDPVNEEAEEEEVEKEGRGNHPGSQADAGQAFRSPVVFRDTAHGHPPPETSVDLDVPFFPAGVGGVVPSLLFKRLDHRREQELTAYARFIPEDEFAEAADFARGEVLLLGGDYRFGGAFELQPGEVTSPSADQRLGESQEGDQQARTDRVEARFQLCMNHVGEGHQEGASEHEVCDDAQGGEGDRKNE